MIGEKRVPALVVLTSDDAKERDTLKYIFSDPDDYHTPHVMGLWDQWSQESKNEVMQCIARGWLTMEWSKPTEKGFQLWLLCHRDFLKDNELNDEEMKKRYHQEYHPCPRLGLTDLGREIIKKEDGAIKIERYASRENRHR